MVSGAGKEKTREDAKRREVKTSADEADVKILDEARGKVPNCSVAVTVTNGAGEGKTEGGLAGKSERRVPLEDCGKSQAGDRTTERSAVNGMTSLTTLIGDGLGVREKYCTSRKAGA